MGQQCCAASENAPEIIITPDDNDSKSKTKDNQKSDQGPKPNEVVQKSQKNEFYGKDGHVHSKTITKQMSSSIDSNLDEYKKIIFTKQNTITEVTDEDEASQIKPKQRSNKQIRLKREQDVIGQFLGDMAYEISSAVSD